MDGNQLTALMNAAKNGYKETYQILVGVMNKDYVDEFSQGQHHQCFDYCCRPPHVTCHMLPQWSNWLRQEQIWMQTCNKQSYTIDVCCCSKWMHIWNVKTFFLPRELVRLASILPMEVPYSWKLPLLKVLKQSEFWLRLMPSTNSAMPTASCPWWLSLPYLGEQALIILM